MKKVTIKNVLLPALFTVGMMLSVAGCIAWEHDYYDEPPVAYYRPYSRTYYYYPDYPYRYSYSHFPRRNDEFDND